MAEILPIDAHNPEPDRIERVRRLLDRGEVVVVPTDTVYGLAANPMDLAAVDRVYDIKSRSRLKPLSLLVSGITHAEELARDIPSRFYKLAEAFWPGPLTIIVNAGTRLPRKVTANTGHVALRHPLAPIAVALILESGYPLTATSANLSGHPECSDALQADLQLGKLVPLIVDGGEAASRLPSTIVDLTALPPRIMREGVIPTTAVEPYLE